MVQVITIRSSTIEPTCRFCGKDVAALTDPDYFDKALQHYLGHGFKLKHVGQETDRVDEGLWHLTVAILVR